MASASASPSVSPSRSPSLSPSKSPSASPSVEPFQVISPSMVAFFKGVYVMKWLGLRVTGDIGKPIALANFPDKSVQLIGIFGAGGTVVIQGNNKIDPDNPDTPPADDWQTLTDPLGSSLSFTSAGLKQIQENTYWIRPYVSAGVYLTDVDVYLVAVSQR